MSLKDKGSLNIYIPQGAIDLNGTDSYVDFGTNYNSVHASSNFSIGIKFKPDNISEKVLVSEVTPPSSYLMHIRGMLTTNKLNFQLTNNTGAPSPSTFGVTSNSSYNDGKSHTVVCTWDKTLHKAILSIDSTEKVSQIFTSNDIKKQDKNSRFRLGRSSSYCYDGMISELIYWSGIALTDNEIRKYYNGIIPREDKIGVYFKMNERKGNKIYDFSSFGVTGSLFSCSWKDNPIRCWCNRWDEGNYDIVLETMMDACDRNYLFENVHPGQLSTTTTNLGWVINTDISYKSGNTLILEPLGGYGVSSVRERTKIVVKNISDTFLNRETFGVKIEGLKIKKWSDYI